MRSDLLGSDDGGDDNEDQEHDINLVPFWNEESKKDAKARRRNETGTIRELASLP
jgi:hypothetical protein